MTPTSSTAVKRDVREDYLGASTFVEKGWNMIAIGNFSGAEVMLLRGLELAPSDLRGRSLLGWARMSQGMFDEAERLLLGVLAENSFHAMTRANLGYVCMRKGEHSRAAELLVSASRQSRDAKAVLYANFYHGLLHSVEGNFPEAEECFRRAIYLAPNFIEGYYELGRALLSGGRTDEARATWKAGHSANRFNIWGKRCIDAIRFADRGEIAPSYS